MIRCHGGNIVRLSYITADHRRYIFNLKASKTWLTFLRFHKFKFIAIGTPRMRITDVGTMLYSHIKRSINQIICLLWSFFYFLFHSIFNCFKGRTEWLQDHLLFLLGANALGWFYFAHTNFLLDRSLPKFQYVLVHFLTGTQEHRIARARSSVSSSCWDTIVICWSIWHLILYRWSNYIIL
jgi:hypothetical protein